MATLRIEFLVVVLAAIGGSSSLASTQIIPARPSDDLQLNKNIKITKATKDNCTIYSCEAVLPQPLEIGWLSCKDHHDCKQKLLQKEKYLNFTNHGDCTTSRSEAIGIASSIRFNGLILCRKTSNKSSYTFKVLAPSVTVHIEEDKYQSLPRITKLRNSSKYIDAIVINTTYFVGDPIHVTCGASNVLFHSQPEVLLVNSNGQLSEVMKGESWNDSDVVGTEITTHLVSLNVTEVLCRAQRWDTGEWEHASYPLDVRAHIPIKRLNSSAPVIELKGNEQSILIFCVVEGGPQPSVLWEKDGETYEGDLTTRIFAFGVVAQITFPQASYEKHGYKKNIAGDYILYAEEDGKNKEMCRTKIIIESNESKLVDKTLVVIAIALSSNILVLLFKKKFKFPMSSLSEITPAPSSAFHIVHGKDGFQRDVVLPREEYIPPFSGIPGESFVNPTHYGPDECVYGTFLNVPGNAIVLGECIGAGTSGSVYKGQLYDRNVAVKRLVNSGTEWFRTVTRELNILATVGDHPHIIELVTALKIPNAFGANLNDVAIVMEYCENGDLRTYLRKHREYFKDEILKGGMRRSLIPCSSGYTQLSEISANCVTTSDLLQWTVQFACAMDYLASKHIVHGDLALRNLLLTGSKVLKVSDFGLSKRLEGGSEYYKIKSDERIPWANCAPEFLEDFRASTATDVWAFGVATWEMFTLGETPYLEKFDSCSYTFRNALKYGHRLPKPAYANLAIYEIMLKSWHADPRQRPSFGKLILALKEAYSSFVGYLNQGPTSSHDNTASNEIGN